MRVRWLKDNQLNLSLSFPVILSVGVAAILGAPALPTPLPSFKHPLPPSFPPSPPRNNNRDGLEPIHV